MLYEENLYQAPLGVSPLTIRVFIPPFTFSISEGLSLYIFFSFSYHKNLT